MRGLAAFLGKLANRGKYPTLREPDPDEVDTRRDRMRYYAANVLALLIGAAAGFALWLVPPITEAGTLWRSAWFDHAVVRLIAPCLFVLPDDESPGYRDPIAAIAAEHSGRPIRRVERE